MHRHGPKPHGLAGGKRRVQAVKDAHLGAALVPAVQIQGDGGAVSLAKLTRPSWRRPGFQGRGYNLGGHQVARVKQQAKLVESHN